MVEKITIGGLELEFLQEKDGTGGSLDFFRMTVQPKARVPIPHYHESWDETVYGLSGTILFRVDGKDAPVGPGECLFIPRGAVHHFSNDTAEPTTCLCILTPGVLGPGYFREIAALLAGGPPDPAAMKSLMLRYGLVPVVG
ncbi:cupin domain-containing protein [Rhizobium tubonense]|uniref:Cupin n=1 Tax=Rhizobium tubonense TaxID=484088 RepID=A0A2W4CJC9_9HYPH|nr:cupin domain-containing protein [Rhizobium tubonense]PZM13032.1 cupin [Rhizobium tubonense]